jgi:hypothetical protein
VSRNIGIRLASAADNLRLMSDVPNRKQTSRNCHQGLTKRSYFTDYAGIAACVGAHPHPPIFDYNDGFHTAILFDHRRATLNKSLDVFSSIHPCRACVVC